MRPTITACALSALLTAATATGTGATNSVAERTPACSPQAAFVAGATRYAFDPACPTPGLELSNRYQALVDFVAGHVNLANS